MLNKINSKTSSYTIEYFSDSNDKHFSEYIRAPLVLVLSPGKPKQGNWCQYNIQYLTIGIVRWFESHQVRSLFSPFFPPYGGKDSESS